MTSNVPTVGSCCLSAYHALPRHGKPDRETSESTVLSGIVLESAEKGFQVVSLATGTKCLSAVARSCDGSLVHDSHAEVLARRAALLWLYREFERVLCKFSQYKKNQKGAYRIEYFSVYIVNLATFHLPFPSPTSAPCPLVIFNFEPSAYNM
jgi:hypothetical protein